MTKLHPQTERLIALPVGKTVYLAVSNSLAQSRIDGARKKGGGTYSREVTEGGYIIKRLT